MEGHFLPYQLQYINCQKKFVLVEKAVRIGLTFCHSWKAAIKRITRHPDLPRIREIFASKNLVVASEYLRYHRQWADAWNAFQPGLIDMSRWTTEKCVYPGGDILIVSSDPNAFRGMEADITLDEYAFHAQQPELYSAAQSRIMWLPDGQLTLISSHAHPDTTFARLAEMARRNRGPFSGEMGVRYAWTLYDAVEQGLALKVPGIHQNLLVEAA